MENNHISQISSSKEIGVLTFVKQTCRRYLAEIFPIRRKTIHNQSNKIVGNFCLNFRTPVPHPPDMACPGETGHVNGIKKMSWHHTTN